MSKPEYEITIEAKIRKKIRVCPEDARAYFDFDGKPFDVHMAEEIAHNMFSVLEDDIPEKYSQKTVHVKKI